MPKKNLRKMWRDLRRASSRVVRPRVAARCQHTVRYTQAYERSLTTPQDFWAEQAQRIEWFKPWDQVLDEYVRVPRCDWRVCKRLTATRC